MPIVEGAIENAGTDSEGEPISDYCMICFRDGHFTKPDQTVDEMVRSSIDFMTANLGFATEQATQMSNDVIRKLKRWN